MLVKITNRCHEGCSHCLDNASPDGHLMRNDTFSHVVMMLRDIHPLLIQVSGGEPTEHPMFFSWIRTLAEQFPVTQVVIESNGSFHSSPEKLSRVRELLTGFSNIYLQVTTHPIYYPNYTKTMGSTELRGLPKTLISDKDIMLFPFGRAVKNHQALLQKTTRHPSCSNVYLLQRQFPTLNFEQFILEMHRHGKLCTPMIDYRGVIRVGEGPDCTIIGDVFGDRHYPMKKIARGYPCGKCGLVDRFRSFCQNQGHESWFPGLFRKKSFENTPAFRV